MDGPVQIPFKSFIRLQPNGTTALYLQIVFEFIKAIQMGLLPEGTKLPGTRLLCKVLLVNRNTLVKAFQDLESQGWIQIVPNKGTFILSAEMQRKNSGKTIFSDKIDENSVPFSFKISTLLDNPVEGKMLSSRFNDGLPDLRLVHTDVLARLYVAQLKRQQNVNSWEKMQAEAHENFKSQLSNLLNVTRGLRISTANLLTTSNHEASLYLATKVLISAGDKVAVASPGYYLANMTLADSGAKIISVPVDDEGIDVQYLSEICKENQLRLLYLTSSYHYPTTIQLSPKRRIEIVELSKQYNFIILEDDYDFDLHFDNNPILPLTAFDSHKNIIYVGSFGKLLPSGFGYGFVTGPVPFIAELQKHQNLLESKIDPIKEQVLANYIDEGELYRQHKKNKKVYKERRDYFCFLLENKLGNRIKFKVPERGLAVWIEFLDKFSLMSLQKECFRNDLLLPMNVLYQTKTITAVRLGFGHLTLGEMELAVSNLANSLEKVVMRSKATEAYKI